MNTILTNRGKNFPTRYPELGASFEDPKHVSDAVEFTVDRRFSNNWSALASYRWSRLFGTFEGFYREDNGQSDRASRRFTTSPPTTRRSPPSAARSSATSATSGSLASSAKVRCRSTVRGLASLAPYDNDSEIRLTAPDEGFETVDGFKKRTPFESQLDMQASYAVTIGGRKVTLLADAFNIFNVRRVTDYNAAIEQSFGVLNPDYGTPTSQNVSGQQFQAPFSLRLGARAGPLVLFPAASPGP